MENKNTELQYYNLENILTFKAHYNIIFGERSNGKTYACLKYAIQNFINNNGTTAYIRRYQEDFKGKRGSQLFQALIDNDEISKLTLGLYDRISYYGGKWYFANYDEKLNKIIRDSFPFCYGFSLSDMEHDKSTSYPTITTIIFDEFISRNGYLFDEFITFMNCISTIVRQRNNIKIFMLGNTINQYCPYFEEFGLTHIAEMQKGDIDVYNYGNSELKVAVEYSNSIASSKPSDLYFAFDNPKLNMIKSGDWELGLYPHLPYKFNDSEIVFTFFIVFKSTIIQAEIVNRNTDLFIYCHFKTTPIKYPDYDLIYTLENSPKPNYFNRIFGNVSRKNIILKIEYLFLQNKVFYQNNTVGEIVRNFIIQSENKNIIDN